jgi:ATP-dependent RNA helicase RhlE
LEGRDVIGIAQTGTGKTAAFTVPVLQKLFNHPVKTKRASPRALILAPTRELAAQIEVSFKDYGKFLGFNYLSVYGGVGITPQIKSLQRGVDILIATPGRLIDLMNQRKVDLKNVEFLVFDEADRVLDMGFLKDVKKIASSVPVTRQSLFFSATMSNSIENLTRDFLKNPSRVEIIPESSSVEKIEQCVFFVDRNNKDELLLDLIIQKDMKSILIFVGVKYRADKISTLLKNNKITSDSIHGNKSQYQRMRALRDFRSGKVKVLVATDIAARGIDIDDISHVINYDLPNEPENYIHRIGRTARAGTSGTAYSFCSADERNYLNQIERIIKRKIEHVEHKYHSVRAKNAVGAEAKPNKRRGRNNRRDSRSNGRRRGSGNSRDGEFRRPKKRGEWSKNKNSKPKMERRDRNSRSEKSPGRNSKRNDRKSFGNSRGRIGTGRGKPSSGGYGGRRNFSSGRSRDGRKSVKNLKSSGRSVFRRNRGR